MPFIFWAHGALSILVLPMRLLPDRIRELAVRIVCGLGVGFGLALFVVRRSGDAWRTTLIEPGAAAIAGVAIAAAWVVVAALNDEDDRWRAASLVGFGGTALALFGAARWIVPALLFWTLSSIVIGALAIGTARRAEVWLTIVVSDLCFAAGALGHVVDVDAWQLPIPAPDRAFWFLLAATIIRVGVVPRFGLWRALGAPSAAAVPLAVGGGFVLAAGAAGRIEPWAAAGLLIAGLAQATWGALRQDLAPATFAGWAPSICLALVYIGPDVVAPAGAAAVLVTGALAVWPTAAGTAQPERGLLLTFAPLTAAFGALVYAAGRAFDLATAEGSVAVRAPAAVVAALIPVVMAVGALLGARVGRERSRAPLEPWPLAATWLFVAASIALGAVPGALELPDNIIGTQRSFLTVVLIAVALAALAGWLWTLRHPDHRRSPAAEPLLTPVGPPTSTEVAAYRATGTPLVQRIQELVALTLALAVAAAVGWVTIEGLSEGFL